MKEDKDLKWIYVIACLDIFSASLASPLLPWHLKSLGATGLMISLPTSLYAGAQLFSSPLVGSWSDHYGRNKTMCISMAICSVGYILLGQTVSLPAILLIRLLLGCFKHTQSLSKALIADLVPVSKQTEAYGVLTTVTNLAFIIGPAIGGNLVDRKKGFSHICIIIFILFWINIGIIQFKLSITRALQPKKREQGKKPSIFKIFIHLKNINWGKHSKILALKFTCVCIFSLYSNHLLRFGELYNFSATNMGYLISYYNIVGSLYGVCSKYVRNCYLKYYSIRESVIKQIQHNFFILLLTMTGLSLSDTLFCKILWITPFGVSSFGLRNLLTELLVLEAPATERGSLIGSSHSFSALGKISSAPLAGYLSDVLNETAVAAGVAAVACVISLSKI